MPFPKERKAIDIGSYYGDYSKANRLLAWKPVTSLELGLQITLDYFQANLQRYL